jgi:nitroreductase
MSPKSDFMGSSRMLDEPEWPCRAVPPTWISPDRDGSDGYAIARELITSRRNVSPRRLQEPGPDENQLEEIIALTAASPDHGLLTPWRFIRVPSEQRHLLAEAFAQALIDRDPGSTVEQIESAREKAYRAPLLLIAIACLGVREPDTPMLERMVSMGAAIQNILLGAHAMGFGAGITSGRAMSSARMEQLCQLGAGEVAVCCINMGTISGCKPSIKPRPVKASPLSTLGRGAAVTHS